MNKYIVFTLTGILILDTAEDACDACNDACEATPDYMWTLSGWRRYREWTRRLSIWSAN